MTTVRLDLRVPSPDGVDVPATGAVEWRPTRRRHIEEGDEDYIVLPDPFVTAPQGDVVVAPTGADWCWSVLERVNAQGGVRRYVVVPESATPVDYADLVDVDPATLDPAAEPEAAWYAALAAVQDAVEQIQAGQVPPEQIEAAVVAYLTENPVEGVTQQQLDDAIAAVELTPGPKGDKGDKGDPGQGGAAGADGQDGASAYEVAVANGFVGTEAAWLASLVGPEGPEGPQGEPGQDATGGSGLLNEVVVHGDSLVTNDNPDFGGGTYFHEHLADELGVPVAGEGYGGADSLEVGGNAGAYRSDVTVTDNTIPASGSVVCTVTNPQYCKAEYGLATGWLGGVYGWWDDSEFGASNTTRIFVRAAPGDAVTVLPGTTWQPERATGHTGKVAMMISGGNDGGRATAAQRIAAYKAVARRYGYRFLAVSSIHLNGHMIVGDENAETVNALDAEFGGLHLNLDALMKSHEGLARAGVTPTSGDTAALESDPPEVPPSLLYSDGSHLNANGYRAFASKAAAILRGTGLITADVTPPPADTESPTAPTIGTPTKTHNTVTLPFSGATDDTAVTGYHLRQDGAVVSGTFGTSPRVVTGLAPSTEYDFEIRARDAAGNVSPWSNLVTVTTDAAPADSVAPTQPGVVVVSGLTATGATLTWPESTDAVGVTGYRVVGVGADRTPTTPTYTFTGLTADTAYSGTVYALDAAGNQSTGRAFSFETEAEGVSGLVARYQFEEGTGTTSTADQAGLPTATLGSAATWAPTGLGGSSRAIRLANAASSRGVQLVPTTTMFPAAATAFSVAFRFKPSAAPSGNFFLMVGSDSNFARVAVFYENGEWQGLMQLANGSTLRAKFVGAHGLTVGTEHVFVLQWDKPNLTLWKDGVQIATETSGGNDFQTFNGSGNILVLGWNDWGDVLGGDYDDLSIYDRALTSGEIAAL